MSLDRVTLRGRNGSWRRIARAVIRTGLLAAGASCFPARPEAAGQRVAPTPIPLDPPAVRHYLAPRAPAPPVIDGVLDDSVWRAASWSEPFTDIEGPRRARPRWETRVRMLWDDTALYVAAALEEPDLWATLTRRDTVIFLDHDFEVFIDPDADTHHYYELEINALGTVWDLVLEKPYRDGGPPVNTWNVEGLRSAVHLDGTLNQPGDRDRGWTVELAIPWRGLGERLPQAQEQWRINFSRVEWTLDTAGGRYAKRLDPKTTRPLPEANWVWSPQYAVNMHMPEMWGIVEFAWDSTGPFHPAADEPLRWALRRLYYAERAYHEEHGRYATALEALGLARMPPDLRLTGDGLEYEATAGGWRIRDDGRLSNVRTGAHQ